MTKIKDRVLKIADHKSVNNEFFCKSIGMSYSNFKGKAKETPLNSDAIANILTSNKEINPIWLITGEGDMLKTNEEEEFVEKTENVRLELLLEDYKTRTKEQEQKIDRLNQELGVLRYQLEFFCKGEEKIKVKGEEKLKVRR